MKWADLSAYQGTELFPDVLGNQVLKGKDVLVGRCFACHGFQSRMASVTRDENGWRDRVNYMRGTMHFFLDSAQPFTDQNADDVTAYINMLFGENSILPESPADIPKYKNLVRAFGDEAMKIVYVQYEMPNRNRFAWSAVPAKDGSFVVPYYGTANRIARLNPVTAAVEEYRVPHLGTAAIHSAVPAPDGSIWLTQQGSNKLGRWDPQTKKIAEYQDTYLPGMEGTTEGRRQAHGTRRQPRPRVVDRHAAHHVRSEDGQVHAHQGRAARLRSRARQGRQLLVRGEHRERKDRQGRRQDAEGHQMGAADHRRPPASHPDRGRRHRSGSPNSAPANSRISIRRRRNSASTRSPVPTRRLMHSASARTARSGIRPKTSTSLARSIRNRAR